jgi:hypothetical protein
MSLQVQQIAVLQPVRVFIPVLCPLGFVHGYRCDACSWAMLFPDCHVAWAVPFCYQMQLKVAFESHTCKEPFTRANLPGCRVCRE